MLVAGVRAARCVSAGAAGAARPRTASLFRRQPSATPCGGGRRTLFSMRHTQRSAARRGALTRPLCPSARSFRAMSRAWSSAVGSAAAAAAAAAASSPSAAAAAAAAAAPAPPRASPAVASALSPPPPAAAAAALPPRPGCCRPPLLRPPLAAAPLRPLGGSGGGAVLALGVAPPAPMPAMRGAPTNEQAAAWCVLAWRQQRAHERRARPPAPQPRLPRTPTAGLPRKRSCPALTCALSLVTPVRVSSSPSRSSSLSSSGGGSAVNSAISASASCIVCVNVTSR
jgi:hypothetical protein